MASAWSRAIRTRPGEPDRARCGRCAEVCARDLRQRAHACFEPRRARRVAGVGGAEIDLGRQHAGQPLVHRLPKRRHHDGHRSHEREAGDDRGQAHRRLAGRRPELPEGEAQRRIGRQRQVPENELGDPRDQRDRAHEQAGDRRVAEERQPAHRARLRQGGSRGDQEQSRPDRRDALEERLLVPAFSARAGGVRAASRAGAARRARRRGCRLRNTPRRRRR